MYLSRLVLNPRDRQVQRKVANPYQMHKWLMRAFPDGLNRERERVLFRVEASPRTGTIALLLQSTLEPRWGWLHNNGARGYLLPDHLLPPGVGENPATKPFDLELSRGQALAFRLRANPTVKRKFENGDHKRVGIYGEEDQAAWLRRKGELGGFRLVSVRTGGQQDVQRTITRQGKKHKLKLAAAQFDGLLQVTDPERLAQTVRQGIGSGKGFGFGLLSLARHH